MRPYDRYIAEKRAGVAVVAQQAAHLVPHAAGIYHAAQHAADTLGSNTAGMLAAGATQAGHALRAVGLHGAAGKVERVVNHPLSEGLRSLTPADATILPHGVPGPVRPLGQARAVPLAAPGAGSNFGQRNMLRQNFNAPALGPVQKQGFDAHALTTLANHLPSFHDATIAASRAAVGISAARAAHWTGNFLKDTRNQGLAMLDRHLGHVAEGVVHRAPEMTGAAVDSVLRGPANPEFEKQFQGHVLGAVKGFGEAAAKNPGDVVRAAVGAASSGGPGPLEQLKTMWSGKG